MRSALHNKICQSIWICLYSQDFNHGSLLQKIAMLSIVELVNNLQNMSYGIVKS